MTTVDPLLHGVARGLLVWVMGSAAWHKLARVTAFQAALASYELVPRGLLRPVAAALAIAELAVGFGLLWPTTVAAAASGAGLLLALYSVAITVQLWRGRTLADCGCGGGAGERPVSASLLVRNIGLLALAAVALAPAGSRALDGGDLVSGLGGVTAAILLYTAADRAAINARLLREPRGAGGIA